VKFLQLLILAGGDEEELRLPQLKILRPVPEETSNIEISEGSETASEDYIS
jgi:hypothetical protein